MAVTIKTITDTTLLVNNKQVVQDANGNWISLVNLTTDEIEALHKHIQFLDNDTSK